jgi:hypothetical protein
VYLKFAWFPGVDNGNNTIQSDYFWIRGQMRKELHLVSSESLRQAFEMNPFLCISLNQSDKLTDEGRMVVGSGYFQE